MLALQRVIGNRRVARLVGSGQRPVLQRQATGVIDAQHDADADIGSLPATRYVDVFREAYYDLGYRAEGGALSTWLTVEYADGTLIDINIYEIVDADPVAGRTPTEAMRRGYVGIGNRIFPAVLTRATVPRLWAAKRAAIQVMEQSNFDFMVATVPAVLFILSLTGSPLIRPEPAPAASRLRARPRIGSVERPSSTSPAMGIAGSAAHEAIGFTRVARNAPELGGFRAGISAEEITALNRQFGGVTTITGEPSSALAAASRQTGFWNKVAAVVREIAGRHMFNDANKRTAAAVVNELVRRNQITTGVEGEALRRVVLRVATGELRTIDEIASSLRGF